MEENILLLIVTNFIKELEMIFRNKYLTIFIFYLTILFLGFNVFLFLFRWNLQLLFNLNAVGLILSFKVFLENLWDY